MNDPEATRRLCAAVVLCALKDAKGRNGGDRVGAIAWLASSKATLYLDMCEIQQSSLLTHCGWMEWAEDVMETLGNLPYEANEAIIDTICITLVYLQELQESQTAVFDSPKPKTVTMGLRHVEIQEESWDL